MTFVRRALIPAAVAIGAVMGPAAVAHASDATLKTTITQQDQTLIPSKTLTKYGSEKKISASQLPTALKVIRAYTPKLLHAASVVEAVTPSSAQGRTGQKEWVAGVREIAVEYQQIANELIAIEHGDRATAAADLKKGLAALNRGKKLLNAADKALGLPAGT